MDAVQTAEMILGVAKQIYDIVQEVRHFKHRSRRLQKRVENLEPAMNKLAISTKTVPDNARTPGGLKLFSKALGEMLQLLQRIRDFIRSLQEKSFWKKMLHMSAIGTEFDEYSEELDSLSRAILLCLNVEMREVDIRAEDRQAQKEDQNDLILEFQNGQDQILEEMKKTNQSQEDIKKLLELLTARPSEEQSSIYKHHRIEEGLKQISPEHLSGMTEISSGRFGRTYKAEYMHEPVAVKSYSISTDKETKELLLKEAENLLYLNSLYVVRLFGVWTKKDSCLLVFEYMARGNLRTVLDEVGADLKMLPWEKRVQMALDGSLGLYRMHNMTPRSLVHQDVGSDIFLVDNHWNVKISGVGFAHTQTSIMQKSKPLHNKRSTLNYISPERLKDPDVKPDASTDVYSYGIVMWEIATGSKPYAGCSNVSEFVLKQKGKLPLTPDCPAGFTELIDKCRDSDALARPKSSEIVAKLQELRSTLEEVWV